MPGPSLVQRQVDALKDLARLAADGPARETKTDADFNKEKAVAERAVPERPPGDRPPTRPPGPGDRGRDRARSGRDPRPGLSGGRRRRQDRARQEDRPRQEAVRGRDRGRRDRARGGRLAGRRRLRRQHGQGQQEDRAVQAPARTSRSPPSTRSRPPPTHLVDTYKKFIVVDPDRPAARDRRGRGADPQARRGHPADRRELPESPRSSRSCRSSSSTSSSSSAWSCSWP